MNLGIGTIKCVNIHTTDSEQSAKFWTEVLGRKVTNKYHPYTELREEGQTKLIIEQVDQMQNSSCNVHFDIKVKDLPSAISRVEALGGGLVEVKTKEEWTWAIMKDPDGNVFCLCD